MSSNHPLDPEARLDLLARLLRHLGWSKALDAKPRPLPAPRGATPPPWLALHSRSPECPSIAFLAPGDRPLTPLRHLYTQFEDLGGEIRHLLAWWREHPPRPDYALVTDGRQTILFDTATEESLLACEEATDLSEQILPHLEYKEVARGGLGKHPRRTSEDFAKDLAGWIAHWMATVGAALGLERPHALELVEAVYLVRLAERLGYAPGHPRIEDWSWGGEKAERKSKKTKGKQGASSPGGASAALRVLRRVWHPLDLTGYLPAPLTEKNLTALAKRLDPPDLLDRWLASAGRLSWKRFEAETLATALADEGLRHRSWQVHVTEGPLVAPAQFRTADPTAWLRNVWEIDLDQAGYVTVLRALDIAVEALRHYNLAQRATALRGQRAHLQLELFESQPGGLTSDLGLRDIVEFALANVLRVRTAHPERARLMRVALGARALELNAASAPLLNPLPDLRRTIPEPAHVPSPEREPVRGRCPVSDLPEAPDESGAPEASDGSDFHSGV